MVRYGTIWSSASERMYTIWILPIASATWCAEGRVEIIHTLGGYRKYVVTLEGNMTIMYTFNTKLLCI